MGRLSLALLGTPEVRHDGRLLSFRTRKSVALLLYLAAEGGLHSREKITALLWPESDDERGRGSLRSALNFLRGELRDDGDAASHLVVGRDLLGFAFDSDYDLDVHHLKAAFALARAPAMPRDLVSKLRGAAERYRGDFLEGFSLIDSAAFDDWASAQRETWHRRADAVFDRLSQELFDGGESVAAREITARWVVFDPLNETAHRRLMQLHLAAGDRAAGLRAYEACCIVLDRELNAEPGPETEVLAERIRSGERANDVSDATTPSTSRPSAPLQDEAPLVGRMAEHAQLVAAYRASRRGKTQAVVIDGEPGMGKSRLVTEFLRWAVAQGAKVLHARAYETGGRLPYQPLVEALRGRVGQADVQMLPDVWLAELTRLLPELREYRPTLSDPPALGETDARSRLLEALARLGHGLAQRATMVLFVDDLQWADTASLDSLQYACRRWAAEETRLLFIASVRSDDLSATPALAEWMTVLGRGIPLSTLSLGPLTAEDTWRLAEAMGRMDGAFAQWLFHETGGHPLFVIETLKSLVEGPADSNGLYAQAAPYPSTTAPGVQRVIHDRLARLSPTAREALAAGAVLGDGFDFERVCRVAGLGEDPALRAVDELLARHVLRESRGGYVFGHDKIREVAYAEAGDARRRLHHRRALDVLEARRSASGELAHHALAAGLVERALPLSIAAGDEAMRLFAARDAARHYEQARALADGGTGRLGDGGIVPPSELSHLYLQLGRAYELTAQYPLARHVYEALVARARAARDPTIECAALNRLANLAATDLLDFQLQASLLGEALALAEAHGDSAGLAETEWNLSRLHLFRMDLEGAHTYAQRSLELASELRLDEQVARTLNWMALIEGVWGKWEDGQAHAERARVAYVALGDRVMEADSLVQLAHSRLRSGQLDDGLAAASAAHSISLQVDNSQGLADAARVLGFGLLERGVYVQALEVALKGVAAARLAGYAPLLCLDLALLGAVHRTLGDLEQARAAHEEASSIAQATGYPLFLELAAEELCADYAVLGEWPQAATHARQAVAASGHPGLYAGLVRWSVVESLLRDGETQLAVEEVHKFGLRTGNRRRYRIPCLRSLAVLAQWRGHDAEAMGHLREALVVAQEIGLVGELRQIESALAETLIGR